MNELNFRQNRIPEFILVLMIILYSGRALPFYSSDFSILIPFSYAAILNIKYHNIKLNQNIVYVISIYLIFIIVYFIKYNLEFDPLFSLNLALLLATSYLTINHLGYQYFRLYQEIIIKLSKISLVFYALQLLFPNIIIKLITNISGLIFSNSSIISSKIYGSIIIYTVNISEGADYFRNAGFAWEPGPYACYLLIAIIMRLSINKMKVDRNLIFMIIALFTTLSTTGYIGLLIVSIWYLYNLKSKLLYIYSPIIIIITILSFINIPFLGNKLEAEILDSNNHLNWALNYNHNGDKSVSIGRFSGILLNWEDLKNNPVIGYGGHFEERIANKRNVGIHSTSGIGEWAAQYGILGIILLIISLRKSIRLIISNHQQKGASLLLLCFLCIFFGFKIIDSLAFMSIITFALFIDNSLLRIRHNGKPLINRCYAKYNLGA